MSKSSDEGFPFSPLRCDVRRGEQLQQRSWLLPEVALTQGLGVTYHIHATVIAVLLSRGFLFHKCRFGSLPAQESLQFLGHPLGVHGVAPAMGIIMKEAILFLEIDQQAPVGSPGCLVGVIIDGEEHNFLEWEVQGLKEQGQLGWAAGALDELRDFRADEAHAIGAVVILTVGKVLEGKPDDMVIEPAWWVQQRDIGLPQQAVHVAQDHGVHRSCSGVPDTASGRQPPREGPQSASRGRKRRCRPPARDAALQQRESRSQLAAPP